MRPVYRCLVAACAMLASTAAAHAMATISNFDTGTYYGGTDGWFPYGSLGAGLIAAPTGSGANNTNWMYVAPNQYYGSFTNQSWANPGLVPADFQNNDHIQFDVILPGSGPNAWLSSNANQTINIDFQFVDSSNTVLSDQNANVTFDGTLKDQVIHLSYDYSAWKPIPAGAVGYNISFNTSPGYAWGWDPANTSSIPYAAQIYLDNIVLTSAADVPEPASLALATLAAIPLLARRRRA